MKKKDIVFTVLIVLGMVVSACAPKNEVPAAVPTPDPCEVLTNQAIGDLENNESLNLELFKTSELGLLLYDSEIDFTVKADAMNGMIYLLNRPLGEAVVLAVACQLDALPDVHDVEQLKYGYSVMKGKGSSYDVVITSVIGGTPHIDFNIEPVEVTSGVYIDLYGEGWVFELLEEGEVIVSSLTAQNISVHSENGFEGVFLTTEGYIILWQRSVPIVVKVVP